MLGTCTHAPHMRMIQIRNVPDEVHRVLRTRAAQAGTTLTDYLLTEIERISRRPTLPELVSRIRARAAVGKPIDSARLVRAERDSRG